MHGHMGHSRDELVNLVHDDWTWANASCVSCICGHSLHLGMWPVPRTYEINWFYACKMISRMCHALYMQKIRGSDFLVIRLNWTLENYGFGISIWFIGLATWVYLGTALKVTSVTPP